MVALISKSCSGVGATALGNVGAKRARRPLLRSAATINTHSPYRCQCPGRDSNPHGLLIRRILSPLRLPIPPPGQAAFLIVDSWLRIALLAHKSGPQQLKWHLRRQIRASSCAYSGVVGPSNLLSIKLALNEPSGLKNH